MSKLITFIIGFFTHNTGPKLISLGLAILLWTIVNAGAQRASTFPGGIPIQIDNRPTGLVAILDTNEVKITLVAERALWQRFTANSFRASLDLTDTRAGVIDKPVIVSSRIPGVQITKIEPERILVRLEPVENKTIPISLKIDGQAADGFVPGAIRLNPSELVASGPKSSLDQLERITASLILSGEEKGLFTRKITLSPMVNGQELDGITLNPSEVIAEVTIVRAADIKNVGILLKTSGALSSGLGIKRLTAIPSIVTISGEPKLLAPITSLATAEIDLSTINQNTEVSIPLTLPAGVKLLDAKNQMITINIEVEQILTTKSVLASVNLTGLRAGFRVKSMEPALVKVEINGPIDLLSNTDLNSLKFDLVASSDLLAPGKRIFKLTAEQLNLASALTVAKIEPDKVEIEIIAE